MDVIEILKFGLPGLVFLLSLLSFRLIQQEQKKNQRDDNMLKTIERYQSRCLWFALLTVAAPLVDKFFDQGNESMRVEAVASPSLVQGGIASVCNGAKYANHYLLLKDNASGKLIQVYAGSVVPCDNVQKIELNAEDARHLGWVVGSPATVVDVVIAPAGTQFVDFI